MSEKENGETIQLDKKTYKILEVEAKKDGLTIPQEIMVASLYFLKKHDLKLFEELKQKTDPDVLRVFERETA